MSGLGERIRKVRGKASQEEFARELGINKNSVGFYERGERTPNANVLTSIVGKFEVSPYWLLSGDGPMYQGDTGLSPLPAPPAAQPTQMPVTQAQTPAQHAEELDFVRRENRELREEVRELREENRSLREEHKALREENRELREENRELRRIEAEWLRTRPDKEDNDDTGRLRNSA